jgi:hypothetical protein
MGFREEDSRYRFLRHKWFQAVNKAFHPGKGILVTEVKSLMLASYRLQKYIRKYLSDTKTTTERVSAIIPLLPKALRITKELLEKTTTSHKDGYVGLFYEADTLEILSRSAYRWLKENDKLNV